MNLFFQICHMATFAVCNSDSHHTRDSCRMGCQSAPGFPSRKDRKCHSTCNDGRKTLGTKTVSFSLQVEKTLEKREVPVGQAMRGVCQHVDQKWANCGDAGDAF